MIRGCKDEAASSIAQAFAQDRRIAIDLDAQFFKDVSATDPAANRAIAMLRNRNTRRRGDQSGAGRDVESAGVVAAGAARVEEAGAAQLEGARATAHRTSTARDLVAGLALHFERDQKRRGEDLQNVAVEYFSEGTLRIVSRKRVAGEDRLVCGCEIAHAAARFRKLCSRCFPSGVPIDSG